MRKTPLNKHMRDQLTNFVGVMVDFKDESDRCATMHMEIGRLIADWLLSLYPQNDMVVLEKYAVARVVTSVRHSLPWREHDDDAYGERHVEIKVPAVLIPAQTSTHYTQGELPKPIEQRIGKWRKAVTAYLAHLKQAREPYTILIAETRFYEDVCEVWPEAKQLADRFGTRPLLPARVTPDLIAQIHADMQRRKAA